MEFPLLIPVRLIWRGWRCCQDEVPVRMEFPLCAEVHKFQSTDLCFYLRGTGAVELVLCVDDTYKASDLILQVRNPELQPGLVGSRRDGVRRERTQMW
jgi:hypothetical protein